MTCTNMTCRSANVRRCQIFSHNNICMAHPHLHYLSHPMLHAHILPPRLLLTRGLPLEPLRTSSLRMSNDMAPAPGTARSHGAGMQRCPIIPLGIAHIHRTTKPWRLLGLVSHNLFSWREL